MRIEVNSSLGDCIAVAEAMAKDQLLAAHCKSTGATEWFAEVSNEDEGREVERRLQKVLAPLKAHIVITEN